MSEPIPGICRTPAIPKPHTDATAAYIVGGQRRSIRYASPDHDGRDVMYLWDETKELWRVIAVGYFA